MPFEFLIDKDTQTALVNITGEPNVQECLDAVKKLKARKGFKPGMKVLADLRQSKLALSNTDAQSIAEQLRDLTDSFRDIALYANPTISFQLKMLVHFTDLSLLNIQVCESAEEIEAWSAAPVSDVSLDQPIEESSDDESE